MTDIWALGRLDGVAQAELVATGELPALALVEAAIERTIALEPRTNAVSWRGFAQARDAATAFDRNPIRGPLAGVPYLIKDSLDYTGMPSRSGSRARRPVTATRAEALAQAYDAAGLIAIGKSTMPEFALLPSTEPALGGTTVNPWNPAVSVGGSSGGAAAAVAAGMVPVAHASDGAGSIRIPASCCGLVGLKPSRGANVRARGPHALEDLLTGDALLARSVRDVAAGFEIGRGGFVGAIPTGGPLRIALVMEALDGGAPDPLVADTVEEAGRLCDQLGHIVEPARYPLDPTSVVSAFKVAWAYLGGEVVDAVRAARGDEADALLEPWALGLAERRRLFDPNALEAMMCTMGAVPQAFAAFFEKYDLILSPVLRDPPARIGRMSGERAFEALWDDVFDYVSYTPLHNLAGLPAISLPMGYWPHGPIGVMFAAGRGRDGQLLALGAQLEEAVGWRDRWPDIVPTSL